METGSSVLIIILLFFSCLQENDDNSIPCSFKHLYSFTSEKEVKNGNQASVDLEAIIKINVPKLESVGGEIGLQIADSLYTNLTSEKHITTANYNQDFVTRHNAIVDVLCSIENEMNKSGVDSLKKARLIKELAEKRDTYFDLLLNLNKSEEDASNTKNIINSNQENIKKKEIEKELSIQLKKETGGFAKIFVNNKEQIPLASSTSLNPRITLINYEKNNKYELKIIMNDGDTCVRQIPKHFDSFHRILIDCQ